MQGRRLIDNKYDIELALQGEEEKIYSSEDCIKLVTSSLPLFYDEFKEIQTVIKQIYTGSIIFDTAKERRTILGKLKKQEKHYIKIQRNSNLNKFKSKDVRVRKICVDYKRKIFRKEKNSNSVFSFYPQFGKSVRLTKQNLPIFIKSLKKDSNCTPSESNPDLTKSGFHFWSYKKAPETFRNYLKRTNFVNSSNSITNWFLDSSDTKFEDPCIITVINDRVMPFKEDFDYGNYFSVSPLKRKRKERKKKKNRLEVEKDRNAHHKAYVEELEKEEKSLKPDLSLEEFEQICKTKGNICNCVQLGLNLHRRYRQELTRLLDRHKSSRLNPVWFFKTFYNAEMFYTKHIKKHILMSYLRHICTLEIPFSTSVEKHTLQVSKKQPVNTQIEDYRKTKVFFEMLEELHFKPKNKLYFKMKKILKRKEKLKKEEFEELCKEYYNLFRGYLNLQIAIAIEESEDDYDVT